ncbi:MAG: U32 family peptidase [Chitinispirillaceae bacterium]|nr:U32 family peptidase [Chitinispirillaceae bacterium]
MTTFTMPLNWERDYFNRLDLSQVTEVYGKLREDYPGGGKSSMAQGEPSKREVRWTVEEAHRRGLMFNYLINTTCIGNREFTRHGYRRIRWLLDWLADMGVDRITLAMPFLVELVKKHYPNFGITVSTQAGVNSLEKVQLWENLGADTITLSHVEMNRNFREIRRITANSTCAVQLIVNMICKRGCPFVTLHGNFNAHSSQSGTKTNRYNMDYYFVSCLARNFSDPVSIIKSNWIRPEDVELYEGLGIKKFKIVERGLTTDALSVIASAYTRRRHEGNFMDLVPTMNKYLFMQPGHFRRAVRELFRISFVNIFRLRDAIRHMRRLAESEAYAGHLGIFIDNRSLDGVVERMMTEDCLNRACAGCDFCEGFAREKVQYIGGEQRHAEDMRHLDAILENMVAGTYY